VNAENLVAFSGGVELAKWVEASGNGRRVWFKLADRDALAHFEKATKRRGGKGGQRYKVYVADEDGTMLEGFPDEGWFIGAAWSHTSGASVVLEVADFGKFRDCATADGSDSGDGAKLYLTLVQLDDEERAVDQKMEDQREELAKRLAGGPRSKQAAILFQADDFRRFVATRRYGAQGAVGDKALATFAEADAWVKQVVGFKSKAELDHDPAVWERYHNKVYKWFMSWARHQ
jgi:hypothetical protein